MLSKARKDNIISGVYDDKFIFYNAFLMKLLS